MGANEKNVAVILAGGIGSRYGADLPKQYTLLNGREIISYTICTCKGMENIDELIVVLDKEEYKNGNIAKKYDVQTICGGATRNESFKNALDYVHKNFECEKIVFLEAARPLTQAAWLKSYFQLLDEYEYVESCLKIHDALGGIKERIPNREDYYLIQSPEAYRFSTIYKYFEGTSKVQHAAQQLPEDLQGYRYFLPCSNYKVTVPEDAAIIEYLLANGEEKHD